jgi:hypothetical protein
MIEVDKREEANDNDSIHTRTNGHPRGDPQATRD